MYWLSIENNKRSKHTEAEHPPSSYLNIPKLNTQFSPIPVLWHQEKMIISSSKAKFTARLMRLIPVDFAQ